MKSPRTLAVPPAALVVLLLVALLPTGAQAKAHRWRFTEAFSNADGSVQFIEMFVFDPTATNEIFLSGLNLSSDSHSYTFPNDLPDENTSQRWILIATPDFAALPGAPTPDYVIPAQFFDPAGDSLVYRMGFDVMTIPVGGMPVDGIHSLEPDLDTPVNSPTNFAGDTGSISLATIPLGGAALALLGAGIAGIGSLVLVRRGRATPAAGR